MAKDKIVFDEHILEVSKWERFKLWLWHHKNYKRISLWVKKEDDNE